MFASLWQWLYDLSVSTTVRESFWVFPTLECIHLYSMIFLITIVAAFDLRLAGIKLAGRMSQSLSQLARMVMRWAWISLAVNFVTGGLLFSSKAPEYTVNSAFLLKMGLILVGVVYHAILLPMASRWDDAPRVSLGTKVAGVSSLLLWIGVIAASRWIAFV